MKSVLLVKAVKTVPVSYHSCQPVCPPVGVLVHGTQTLVGRASVIWFTLSEVQWP